MKATIDDLVREQWLRARNSGELVWATKDGKEIPVKDMTDTHIENAIKAVRKANELNEIAAEYQAQFGL